jgi:hypothetical protein
MARQFVIAFEAGPDPSSLVHRIRNFGEALYHACCADGWASISLDEVDRATNQLRVTVRSKRRARRTFAMIERLLESHFLKSQARIFEVATPD